MARSKIGRGKLTDIATRLRRSLGTQDSAGPLVQFGPINLDTVDQLGDPVSNVGRYKQSQVEVLQAYRDAVLARSDTGEYKNLIPSVRSRLKVLSDAGRQSDVDEYFFNLFSSENLDLSVLDKTSASTIYTKYRALTLRLKDVVDNIGLPRNHF